ncbi:energy transducer TonB [Marinicella litoralis]|uniref:Protein TonB n=1 Tax=Marinicella litoralis TaxID=644220 RepID=A0A4R6XPS9_9GAMM|nr:energy transducer TonB [Marinicella litoralis]TDR20409.1 protein TonB [Marinicella litoralis]
MNQIFRYSVSGLLGLFITAALFVGMLSLLKGKPNPIKAQDNIVQFSFVKDYKEAVVKPTPPREKPQQQEISQAPTMPEITMDNPPSPEVDMPTKGNAGPSLNILKGVKMPSPGGSSIGLAGDMSGMIKTAIAPMYPQKELMAKTEGWVKVLITVNEFGAVQAASVVQAKPARTFNAAALKAVKKWRFHPKVVDGKAVAFQVTQTIAFKLEQ